MTYNFWLGDPDVRIMENARKSAKRINLLDGLDPGVLYLTVKDLAARAGVTPKVVRDDIFKGLLICARRRPGRSGVLVDPIEGQRWLDERKRKEIRQ